MISDCWKSAAMRHAYWALAIALTLSASVSRGEGLWDDANLLSDREVKEHDLVTVTAPKPPATIAGKRKKVEDGARKPRTLRDRIARRMGRRFTARVIEALPNGNLVIESQTVTTRNNGVVETLLIGEIRRRDLTEDHTVPLDRVSEIRFSITTRRIKTKAKAEDAAKTPEIAPKVATEESDKPVDAVGLETDAKADDELIPVENEINETIAEEESEEETNDA